MTRRLPGRFELAVFVTMALVAGLLVTASDRRDAMLFFLTLPVFLIAAYLGYKRKMALQAAVAEEQSSAAER